MIIVTLKNVFQNLTNTPILSKKKKKKKKHTQLCLVLVKLQVKFIVASTGL